MQSTTTQVINPNPIVNYERKTVDSYATMRSSVELDTIDIFDAIRDVNDPEHPYTLEQLNVISEDDITLIPSHGHMKFSELTIYVTPTVPHCTLVYNIALSIRSKLNRVFGDEMNQYKVNVFVKSGSHNDEAAVNRQINDKERVAAAMENPSLMELIDRLIGTN